MLLILGAMDIGRMITVKIVMTNAAREGANYLSRRAFLDEDISLNTRMAETRDLIWDYCDNQNVAIDKINDISITNCCTATNPVSITVSNQVDLFYGNILQFFGFTNSGAVLVATDVQMRVK
jgi:Flp pilus assembly protein TadG